MAGRAFARDEMNIRANTPSPLLPQSSVQKGGGGVFSGAYGTVILARHNFLSRGKVLTT